VTTFSKEDRDAAIEKATKAVEKAREGFEGSRQRFEVHLESYGRTLYRLRVAELLPVEGAEIPLPAPCVHDDASKPSGVTLIVPDPPVAGDVEAMIDHRMGIAGAIVVPPVAETAMTPAEAAPLPAASDVERLSPAEHAVPVNPFATMASVAASAAAFAPPAPTIDERAEEASRAALARTAEQEREHALAGLDEEKRARVAAALAGATPAPPTNPFAGLV